MKLRTPIVLSLLACFALTSVAQDYAKYMNLIDSANMRTTLTRLASDEFLGRKTDNEGIKLAELYLIEQLKSYKIASPFGSTYKQDIEAHQKLSAPKKYFNLGGYNYSNFYSYQNSATQDSVISGDEIVFAGYGVYHSTLNDFAKVDINNKIVMLLSGNGPNSKYGVQKHNASRKSYDEYFATQKPKAVITVEYGFDTYGNYNSKDIEYYSSSKQTSYPSIRVNEILANRILEPSGKSIKQILYESEHSDSSLAFSLSNKVTFNGNYQYQNANLNNLIAVVEGSDLKSEYVVVTAHYDHVGTNYRKEVLNGADDNASGVSALLEMARVLSIAKKEGKGPRRSVLFILLTAEEDGLKGAEYYVNNPVAPLKKTVVCLNMDMVGRIKPEPTEEELQKGYIHAITGTYSANDSLSNAIDSINSKTIGLTISKKYSNYFRQSDQYEFASKDVPAVMFTSGEHPDYHRTTDDVEKINFPALRQRAQLIFATLWEFANTSKPFISAKKE